MPLASTTEHRARRFAADKLVIATHNPGKLEEIAALLAPFGEKARHCVHAVPVS